jgi:hypothetical protein
VRAVTPQHVPAHRKRQHILTPRVGFRQAPIPKNLAAPRPPGLVRWEAFLLPCRGMSRRKPSSLQPYPRRADGAYLADDSLFPKPERPLEAEKLRESIKRAFERCLKNKKGETVQLPQSPEELVKLCILHLKERGDPVLSPSFYCQVPVEDVFELDAVPHEMQRHRMRIGNFYQFLVIELMRHRFRYVYDGKREGDVEAEIDPPGLQSGLRIFMSVKKSADTVGGQDVGGMISRLERMAAQDKNLTSPYLNVVCIATPQRGRIESYEKARHVRLTNEGVPYSPNTEEWTPGFIFPYVTGLHPNVIYETAREMVGGYLPFYSLAQRTECSTLLVAELKRLGLVDETTGRLDPDSFTRFISHIETAKKKVVPIRYLFGRKNPPSVGNPTDPLNEAEPDESASE